MENRERALERIKKCEPIAWANEDKIPSSLALRGTAVSISDVLDAQARLDRFAPYIALRFPETGDGIIESPISEAPELASAISEGYGVEVPRLLLKRDSDLPVAGSIKARGGIHEILALAEGLAVKEGLLRIEQDYSILARREFRDFFSKYSVAVGSTGNLGISVGIMSAELGFDTTVHMSQDAKEWKKSLLRSKGVTVIEHESDYSEAVHQGRDMCESRENCYFVDDERSSLLFSGYAVAALRLRDQLKSLSLEVDSDHPLRVYLPCGVGGAPGGIAFGLKQIYGDSVHCWFVEPTHAPCMSLAMVLGRPDVSVSQFGIDGVTEADGLAVGAPSDMVWSMCHRLIDGIITVEDDSLYELQYLMDRDQGVKAEPSAAAALCGLTTLEPLPGEAAIAWLTGGSFLPEDTYKSMLKHGGDLWRGKR
ncbi:D-serine ammonia-lyase [Dethiosulfovibrio salsuginis]|uniref:Probable D-serine dehydratase n=1 Tax=Dethiosulfovibrio salsuginis TaxID=561720 RepID=A0A1X7LAT8_9BACT|nr:D-serine ammonia-lyase [Dethiosulfovibrio salsuginis]SMG50657.1 D-serine ammonia-lyase [Dethiosulfovibrio salsuginis]